MIKDIKQLIETKLQEAINNKLSANLRIPVEIPPSIDNYKLSHPIGTYLVVYRGSKYISKDLKLIVAQNRDVEISVIVVCRFRSEYTPEDYLDFAIKNLSGIEVEAKRTDRKIYCISDEWIGEENGVWWYGATFVVPSEFFEEVK